MLAELVGLGNEPEQLRHEGFALGGCDVLRENLKFLLSSLGHGGKRLLLANSELILRLFPGG